MSYDNLIHEIDTSGSPATHGKEAALLQTIEGNGRLVLCAFRNGRRHADGNAEREVGQGHSDNPSSALTAVPAHNEKPGRRSKEPWNWMSLEMF